jgi:S-DNA-T family DNA segregation ATPase FtsK/SpoIIIE
MPSVATTGHPDADGTPPRSGSDGPVVRSGGVQELLLRVRSGSLGDRAVDLVVVVDAHHDVADLVAAIGEHLGRTADAMTVVRTAAIPAPDTPLAALDLLSGDEIVLARCSAVRPARIPGRALALDVIAGPETGRSLVLRTGATTIGRSSGVDFALADPSVSRHHATLRVGAGGELTLLAPRRAGNGVAVDGEPIVPGEPVPVAAGAIIALGGTRAVVRRFERRSCDATDRLGQLAFLRTPYRPPLVRPVDTDPIGPIPARPEPRRLQLIALVAPLAAGLLMYAVTRHAQFLLFILISPVVMVGTAIDDRRTGRRKVSSQLDSFRVMLTNRRAELERLAEAERRERLRSAPDVAELIRRAELRTIDLWARGRDAPDFLRLRLGLADDTACFPITVAAGGDDDLREQARVALAGVDLLTDVPVTVDVTTDVIAVHGARELVDGVAASLLIQAATLHSPDDLTIVGALDDARGLAWIKWLPHVRSVTSPVAGQHLAADRTGIDALLGRLLEVATFRAAEASGRPCEPWPRVLGVLDASLGPDPAAAARLLGLAAAAGIGVIWLAESSVDVPRHATRVLEVAHGVGARMSGHLWATDPSVPARDLEVEHVRPAVAETAARALAPVRDASTASLATSIPRTAPLIDVLGGERPTAASIARSWCADDGYQLRFPIGVAADGVRELDLVDDGPHALIGGTSGSGKSELLQSMVAGLAARHSPSRLNFLFVDYKGGASSQVFERLPHTVGYVTNLSSDLALRALTSLRAELHRRMTLLQGRAKDIGEMLECFPGEAPPSLVIVVDEFATLVKEVPEFVAGIVDIAQRGRSLGIHLVLATQRPTGSVDENILANTNLRIALRMLDRAESSAIVDRPDAAAIPVPLRGRGLVRLGPRDLVEFQSAYAAAPLVSSEARSPVLVAPFGRSDSSSPAVPPTPGAVTSTHLDVVLDAISGADAELGSTPPRRPWRDVLPEVVTLDSVWDEAVVADHEPGRSVVVGLLDAPESQEQRPLTIDLEEVGGLAVFGSGGSGKTTLLRTIAAGVERGGGAATVVFDFASRGLTVLRALPSVIDVATADDLEAVTRHLVVLDAELDRRRQLLAEHGAEHLTALHERVADRARAADQFDGPDLLDRLDRLDRLVVLIDGFGALCSALLDPLGGVGTATDRWSEIVHRLIIDGRQVGIHTVLTSDRRQSVPARIQSAVGARLVLRHADPQSYGDLGVPLDRAATIEATPGRAILDGSVIVQLASVSADPSARGQLEALDLLVAGVAIDGERRHPLASRPLPDDLDCVPASATAGPVVGIADVSGAPIVLDTTWSHVAIVGPARSGRSTALAAFLAGLDPHVRSSTYVVGPISSPLVGIGWPADRSAFGRADEVSRVLAAAAAAATSGRSGTVHVVADDVDAFDELVLAPVWDRLLADDHVRLVGSVETRSTTGYTTSSAVNELRRARRQLVLQPDDPAEFLQLTGMKLPVRPGVRLVPGRGVLIADRRPVVVQIRNVSRSSMPFSGA